LLSTNKLNRRKKSSLENNKRKTEISPLRQGQKSGNLVDGKPEEFSNANCLLLTELVKPNSNKWTIFN